MADRVLLVYDVPGWAWHHKARAIQRHLRDEFERLDILPLRDVKNVKMGKYHSIHFFGWLDGLKYQRVATAGISSHNFLYKHKAKALQRLPRYRALTAVSAELYGKLRELDLNQNIYLCENGVDCEMFTPRRNDGPFTVGWVGQPSRKPLDQHGYETHWLPLKERLQSAGVRVAELSRTWQNAMPHADMVKFYHDIDVLVHTGLMTGTPNPMFEAAACGKPTVSTPIGCAPEFIVHGSNGLTGAGWRFMETVLLTRSRDEWEEMGRRARIDVVANWQWKDKAREWLPVLQAHRRVL